MHAFWNDIIRPSLDALGATRIVEIGSEYGITTKLLSDYAADQGSIVESIDPVPRFNVQQWQQRYGGKLHCHEGLSIDVIPRLPPFNAALIDGDHNWYTVYHELKAIEAHAAAHGTMPIVFLHDIGWPYGLRDMYYDASRIPEEFRLPHRTTGIDDKGQLSDEGFNAHFDHALHEGGPRNGVKTAVMDFLKEHGDWDEHFLDAFHGLAILMPKKLKESNEHMQTWINRLALSDAMKSLVTSLEDERVKLLIEHFDKMISREKTLRSLRESEARSHERLEHMQHTLSWRITMPLRYVGSLLKKR